MKTQGTPKAIRNILIVLVIAIAEFVVAPTQAQNFHNRNFNRGTSKPIVALTVGLGTRSSFIKSDLDYINKMRPSLEGWESSLMVGGDKVKVRTGFGSFKTAMSDVNSIKQTSFNGLANVYLPGMTKHFRPYIITGLDVNIIVFTGSFIPKSPLILANPAPLCTCQSSSLSALPPPPNPGETDITTMLTPEEPASTTPEINSGKMTSTQLVSGLGGEFNFRMNGRFLSMFGEMRYGLPIAVTTQNASMNETKVKNNLALTFGVAVGLSGKHKIRNSIR